MRTFHCRCGNRLHFENTRCLACGRTLGYLPESGVLSALEPAGKGLWRALPGPATEGGLYRQCRHYAEGDLCNWMVPANDPEPLCRSCRLNETTPSPRHPHYRVYWRCIEQAKRRLIYGLDRLGLPVTGRREDPRAGLSFVFTGHVSPADEFADPVDSGETRVLTGHLAGCITLNLAEADDVARERMRTLMNERYRTLLGHFRHEIGHYYWDRLVRDTDFLEPARALFGDERIDYDEALRRYYENGPPPGWQNTWISAYATAHPWEDWAESFAHYLHMVDTLDSARDYRLSADGRAIAGPEHLFRYEDPRDADLAFGDLINEWMRLTVAINALNRSMGMPDAYPFALTPAIADKLRMVNGIVRAGRELEPRAWTPAYRRRARGESHRGRTTADPGRGG